jgi:hypothetical protein
MKKVFYCKKQKNTFKIYKWKYKKKIEKLVSVSKYREILKLNQQDRLVAMW